MGCYGKFETFYRFFVKLARTDARFSGGNIEVEDKKRIPEKVISLFSGEPFVPDLPAEMNSGKLNIAGFNLKKDENIMVRLSLDLPAATKKYAQHRSLNKQATTG
jgi:hypothetical protein